MKQRILIVNSGGDCPGMNAVIRSIVKRTSLEDNYEVFGSINGFDGIISEPLNIVQLTEKSVSGIVHKGGTILMTNKKDPFNYPVKQEDGSTTYEDVTDKLIYNLKVHHFNAVIHIGGNRSLKIAQKLSQKGVNIVGVPKTINNNLSVTDYTFGFNTAAQIATEAVDKLTTTASSHNRVLVLEVMGPQAGWIALHAAIAGGADVCLIPEVPFDMEKVLEKLKTRYTEDGKGFANIVVAEGAYEKNTTKSSESESIARKITARLKEMNFKADIRETILGYLQRGGTPMAYDRVLATALGVKAFELVQERNFGTVAVHQNSKLTQVDLQKVIDKGNKVQLSHNLIRTAKGIGINFGD